MFGFKVASLWSFTNDNSAPPPVVGNFGGTSLFIGIAIRSLILVPFFGWLK